MSRLSFVMGPGRPAVQVTAENGQLVVRTPYDPDFVQDLKELPASDRRFDPTRKVWLVTPDHGKELGDLVLRHFGVQLNIPNARVAVQTETRLVEVRYLGIAKDRGKGERTAFGWSEGGWNVIVPETVLRDWFGQQAKPGELLTLYAVLGVKSGAGESEIKSAYRRMARQWHPDVCKEPDAAEQFRAIQHAYDILRDPLQRRKYDAGLKLVGQTRTNTYLDNDYDLATDIYRPPLRCGLILAEGVLKLGKFNLTKIVDWADIINSLGQSLVTSWPAGADMFVEDWN
jgi:hypothetical protein